MSAPADKKVRITGQPGSDVQELATQLNAVIVAQRAMAAKLDADAGVTDADYVATITDVGAAKVLPLN